MSTFTVAATPRVLILTVLTVSVICAHGEASAQDVEAASECRSISDATARLACYDAAFGGVEPSVIEQDEPIRQRSLESPVRGPLESRLDERWELSPGSKQGTFHLRPYKPVYILAAFHASSPNRQPRSANPENTATSPLDVRDTEAKYQISFKSKLWENVIGDYSDLWFAYTESSRWQLYNAGASRPFRETDYEPEVMLTFRTPFSVFGWEGRMAGIGINHQSNGRSIPLSRSWNRLIGTLGLEKGDWTVTARYWSRINEDPEDDDNPDIEDYIGRADLLVTRTWRRHELALSLSHSLRDGERSRGSIGLDWAFPISGNLRGYLQIFNGYGESLIDYNHSATYVGFGVSLVNWYPLPVPD